MKRRARNVSAGTKKKRLEHEVEGGTAGALAGAAMGGVAGPPGAIAGAVVGAIAGAVAGLVVEEEAESRAIEDRRLDRMMGVSGGELGAPNLKHPPAKIGAYSAASMGAGESGDNEPAEGPIPPPKT